MTSADDQSSVVRAAVRVGRMLGDWRRRRVEAAQDRYIDMWKSAWAEGCHAGWHGVVKDAVPYRTGPQHDAWSAGWHWAETHPSATSGRSINIPERQSSQTYGDGPSVLRSAGRGALGVAFVAAARWLWLSRGKAVPTPSPASEDSSGNESTH